MSNNNKASQKRAHVTIAQKELGNYLDQIKDEERARVRNNFLLYCVALLSLFGLGYVLFAKNPTNSTAFYPTLYTQNPPILEASLHENNSKQSSKKMLASVLPTEKDVPTIVLPASFAIIGGEKEANEYINFSFSNLSKENQYVLDLGNGSMMDIHNSKLAYAYKKDGIYKISLKVKTSGGYSMLYSQDVKILPSIEVEPVVSGKN